MHGVNVALPVETIFPFYGIHVFLTSTSTYKAATFLKIGVMLYAVCIKMYQLTHVYVSNLCYILHSVAFYCLCVNHYEEVHTCIHWMIFIPHICVTQIKAMSDKWKVHVCQRAFGTYLYMIITIEEY